MMHASHGPVHGVSLDLSLVLSYDGSSERDDITIIRGPSALRLVTFEKLLHLLLGRRSHRCCLPEPPGTPSSLPSSKNCRRSSSSWCWLSTDRKVVCKSVFISFPQFSRCYSDRHLQVHISLKRRLLTSALQNARKNWEPTGRHQRLFYFFNDRSQNMQPLGKGSVELRALGPGRSIFGITIATFGSRGSAQSSAAGVVLPRLLPPSGFIALQAGSRIVKSKRTNFRSDASGTVLPTFVRVLKWLHMTLNNASSQRV